MSLNFLISKIGLIKDNNNNTVQRSVGITKQLNMRAPGTGQSAHNLIRWGETFIRLQKVSLGPFSQRSTVLQGRNHFMGLIISEDAAGY